MNGARWSFRTPERMARFALGVGRALKTSLSMNPHATVTASSTRGTVVGHGRASGAGRKPTAFGGEDGSLHGSGVPSVTATFPSSASAPAVPVSSSYLRIARQRIASMSRAPARQSRRSQRKVRKKNVACDGDNMIAPCSPVDPVLVTKLGQLECGFCEDSSVSASISSHGWNM